MTVDWLLLALAFPAVLINVGHGQNGFLTAALLGGALVVLDRRPIVAGILFGLLVYKPQYGLMLPLVLAVSGRWKCFAAAAATVVLLTIVTTLTFGASVWHAFLSRPISRAPSCSNRAIPAGTRSKASSPGRACGARRFRWPMRCRASRRRWPRRRAGLAVARRGALSAQGGGALPRHHPRHALTASTTT